MASPGSRRSSLFPVLPLSNQLQPVARLVFLKGFSSSYFFPKEPTCLSQEVQVLIMWKTPKQLFPYSIKFPLCVQFLMSSSLNQTSAVILPTLVIPSCSMLLYELFLSTPPLMLTFLELSFMFPSTSSHFMVSPCLGFGTK